MLVKCSRRKILAIGFILLFVAFSIVSRPFLFFRSNARTRLDSASPSALAGSKSAPSQPGKTSQADARAACLDLPLSFESTDRENEFLGSGRGYRLLLSPAGSQFALAGGRSDKKPAKIFLNLLGANVNAQGVGENELPGKINYLIGNDQRQWRTDVSNFAQVRYQNIYPGIDLVYYGNQRQIEYDFRVSPGADPRIIRFRFIRFRFGGKTKVKISPDGDLVLRISDFELREKKPIIYQEIAGERETIAGRYVLNRGQVGFDIGSYDQSQPLLIDPTLVYSTYLGGAGDDTGSSIAIDQNNNIYVAGTTASTNFPTMNPAYPANAGLSDIFVTKIDPAGANVLYSTYVGGAGNDRADGIALDASGNAYVVGRADSSSTNFPTTPGVIAPTYRGGDFDGLVFKLNAQGNGLSYATYLGGEDNDSTEGIAVDANGNAYVTGGSRSHGFPATPNAFQSSNSGDTDAYLTKINSTATAYLYSTLLGGSGTDRGSGVAIDTAGNAYISGYTSSVDFPTENAFQNSFGGSFDAFVTRIDTNQSGANSLVFCSYLGGTADDKGYGIALDSSASNLFLVGQTSSNNFPVLNPAQPLSGGTFDAFITKVSSAGAKVFATYLGGSGDDRGSGIAVNSAGEAYITGFTSSTNFPTASPLQISNGGAFDAFVAKLNSAGSAFLYSTYLGGSANENTTSTVTSTNPIALNSSSDVYLTGYTSSTNFPTASPLQAAKAAGQDAFIARISDAAPPADYSVTAVPGSQIISPGASANYTITATSTGGFTGTISLSVSGQSNDSTTIFNPSSIMITDVSPQSSTLTVTTTTATPPGTYSLTINTTSGNLQHMAQATLIVQGPQSVNLVIAKTASPNPAIALANLTYRLTVTNAGPSPATNVVMTDTLPGGVNFVSATPTQGSCTGSATITCNLGSMSNGAQSIVSIVVVPQSTGQLTNTAVVSASETDPDTSNNSVTIQTTVNNPQTGPSMLDPNLSVSTVVSGLSQPTMMAFIGNNDFLVLEKDTGKVQRVINGIIQSTPPLDSAVNSASERGLLGIALHPNFALNHYVYLYWTESSTGVDSTNLGDVPLLGNRVDRYIWNGSALTFDRNLIRLRAYQADAGQPLRGNHNGGIVRFGPDGKLYILMGDNGRRGVLQNNQMGPVPDDQYGGPEPDNAHLTGFILRLNDDGSTPPDNPFYNAQTNLTGEAAANIKKLFAYGVRNGFGLAFDPLSGNLWDQENGDDAYDEMNRVTAGANNGWVQIMGPVNRIAEYKQIETTYGAGNLQQLRWPPSQIADTPADALARLYMLPGAHYNDPEFSWKYAVAPAALGFVQGRGLGLQYEGDMFVGASRTFLSGGFLFRFRFSADRMHFNFNDDPRLIDNVADNTDKFDITESEGLLAGQNFGITTDIETGPNGNAFVVSNTDGKVYEISATPPKIFVATLNGAQEVPPTNSTATGTATLMLTPEETSARVSLNFSGLSSPQTAAHIHGPGAPGVTAPILFPLPDGQVTDFQIALIPDQVQDLKNGLWYINVHTNNFINGEIRGQFQSSLTATSVQFSSANYFVTEGAGRATIAVTRVGNTSTAASVDFATIDGTALSRTDYTAASGTLSFAPGESRKKFSVLLTDDAYVEGNKTINLILSNPASMFLGSPSRATLTITDNDSTPPTTNPIDDAQFFVRQHYVDFLDREADPGGLAYWTNQITQCGSDAACIADRRISVSAAFFFSPEFQQSGSFVYGLYKAALGRDPSFAEFTTDRNRVIGGPDLQTSRDQLSYDFAGRTEFLTKYPGGSDFVGLLLQTAHDSSGADLTPLEGGLRQDYNSCLTSGTPLTICQGRAVQMVIDYPAFSEAVFNPSFVLMEYFGYLRRGADVGGYNFWLNVLNSSGNNYRGIVCAFITSAEYQLRFSSVTPHSNSECANVH